MYLSFFTPTIENTFVVLALIMDYYDAILVVAPTCYWIAMLYVFKTAFYAIFPLLYNLYMYFVY